MDKTRHLTVMLVLAAAQMTGQFAWAGEQGGVQCPVGFDAEISDSNRALRCVKKAAFHLVSICPSPAVMASREGSDTCKYPDKDVTFASVVAAATTVAAANAAAAITAAAVAGAGAAAAGISPVAFPPLSAFHRVVDKSSTDIFVADAYIFPIKLPMYLGDASKGVRCASGWDGDERFGGNGIRCDKYQGSSVEADCDPGWIVVRDRLGQEDRCLGVNEGPTKPMGMTKIQFDIERSSSTVGWVLDTRSGTDLWRKKVYRYPDLAP